MTKLTNIGKSLFTVLRYSCIAEHFSEHFFQNLSDVPEILHMAGNTKGHFHLNMLRSSWNPLNICSCKTFQSRIIVWYINALLFFPFHFQQII